MCKFINKWTNNQISAKEEAEQISKFMLLKNDTQRVIQVYEELERLTALEMDKRAFEALKTSNLIKVSGAQNLSLNTLILIKN